MFSFRLREPVLSLLSELPRQKHQEYAPIAKTKNVIVRKKNKADKPIDLRSEPMLWETRTRCQQRLILVTFRRALRRERAQNE
jgi:hypothetical protein